MLAFLLMMIGSSVFAQKLDETENQSKNPEIATWFVRAYPLSALTGIKAELSYRFQKANLELNVAGKYYYRDFYWRNRSKSQLPSLFYPATHGGEVFVSLERRLQNNAFSIGGTIGVKSVQTDQFDISSLDRYTDMPNKFLAIKEQQYYAAVLARVRTNTTGFIVEMTAKAGVVYNEINEENTTVYVNGNDSSYNDFISFIFPYVSLGISIGFGW